MRQKKWLFGLANPFNNLENSQTTLEAEEKPDPIPETLKKAESLRSSTSSFRVFTSPPPRDNTHYSDSSFEHYSSDYEVKTRSGKALHSSYGSSRTQTPDLPADSMHVPYAALSEPEKQLHHPDDPLPRPPSADLFQSTFKDPDSLLDSDRHLVDRNADLIHSALVEPKLIEHTDLNKSLEQDTVPNMSLEQDTAFDQSGKSVNIKQALPQFTKNKEKAKFKKKDVRLNQRVNVQLDAEEDPFLKASTLKRSFQAPVIDQPLSLQSLDRPPTKEVGLQTNTFDMNKLEREYREKLLELEAQAQKAISDLKYNVTSLHVASTREKSSDSITNRK